MMDDVTRFLIDHGYVVIFAGVFAEQIGLPLPASPLLLAAGALAGLGRLSVAKVLELAVAASLISDSLWFYLGARRGSAILNFLCRVSLEPEICISKTHSAYSRFGSRSLLFAKFVPGLSALGVPMAGMFGLAPWKFVLLDTCGALAWSGAFVATGWVFRAQLEDLASILAKFGSWLGTVLVVALLLYVAAKYARRRRTFHSLRTAKITPRELRRLMDSGEELVVVDLRAEFERREGEIPGAIALSLEGVDSLPPAVTNREVVLYCSCPDEITSVRAALRLRRRGVVRVRPLEGGFAGWRDLGFPVDTPAPADGHASMPVQPES